MNLANLSNLAIQKIFRINNRFISIKFKLITYFLLIAIIIILIMAGTFYIATQSMFENKSSDLMLEIAKQSNDRIEEFFIDVEKLSLLAAYSSDVQDFLKSDYPNEVRAHEIIANWIQYKTKAFSIYVYNLNTGRNLYINSKNVIDFNYSPLPETWFQKILDSETPLTIVDTHRDFQAKGSPWVMAAGRKIFSTDDGSLLGVMLINISINFVDQVCGKILSDEQAVLNIINDQNVIIYNKDFKNIGKSLNELIPINPHKLRLKNGSYTLKDHGRNYIVIQRAFNKVNWKTILYLPPGQVSLEASLLLKNLLLIVAVLIVLVVIVSTIISNRISKPIQELIKQMEQVEKGFFDSVVATESSDEIGLLRDRFNQMSAELKNLVNQIYHEERLKTEAELSALQAQINPHFLYNTLNSLRWIATIQKADKIVQMVEALIYMLRFTTSKVGDQVSIAAEIENVRNYITIQQVRYYNKLAVEYDIEAGIEDYQILKFTIQPIVENAIFHGLAEKEEGGCINISIGSQNGDILITVADNGTGMDETTIADLQRDILFKEGKFNSIGISNVNARLKMYFGEEYGISFQSSLGEGAVFSILIPKLRGNTSD